MPLFSNNSQELLVISKALEDFVDTILLQRSHTILDGLRRKVRKIGLFVNHGLKLVGSYQQFMHASTSLITGITAFITAYCTA